MVGRKNRNASKIWTSLRSITWNMAAVPDCRIHRSDGFRLRMIPVSFNSFVSHSLTASIYFSLPLSLILLTRKCWIPEVGPVSFHGSLWERTLPDLHLKLFLHMDHIYIIYFTVAAESLTSETSIDFWIAVKIFMVCCSTAAEPCQASPSSWWTWHTLTSHSFTTHKMLRVKALRFGFFYITTSKHHQLSSVYLIPMVPPFPPFRPVSAQEVWTNQWQKCRSLGLGFNVLVSMSWATMRGWGDGVVHVIDLWACP